jgi:lipoprotein-anchoring transpeptidase ErfK/SrfK
MKFLKPVFIFAAFAFWQSTAFAASERIDLATDHKPGTIIVKTEERKLILVLDDGTALRYPIAVGRDGAQWKGETHVTHMRWRPQWRPTPNMRKKNPRLPEVVQPGPSNPLGVAAIYLAEGLLRIHGTNEPSSIGKAASSGCFRMHNDDVTELYQLVQPDAVVIVKD